ncbi:hypothetical protein K474DRAFT_1672489 [Panus rudis PR-1116 ss-1]|nr:hypothetical protein K474DRAFT_1672489 [Panus rudis PR-1116 ss-1]
MENLPLGMNVDDMRQLPKHNSGGEAVFQLLKTLRARKDKYDRYLILAWTMPDPRVAEQFLLDGFEGAVTDLKTSLGPDCMEEESEYVGHYWAIPETRPFIKYKQAMVRFYEGTGEYSKAFSHSSEILSLSPEDNLGERYHLGTHLLRLDRARDALSFAQAWLAEDVARGDTFPPKGGCQFGDPFTNAIPEKVFKEVSIWTPANLLYTAALAAFKLCESPPDGNPPYAPQSHEEAEEYLWLAQDLWMEDDVWKWANSQERIKKLVLRGCNRKDCPKVETRVNQFRRCSSCQEAWYCSTECQKGHWSSHKPSCKEISRLTQEVKKFREQFRPRPTFSARPICALVVETAKKKQKVAGSEVEETTDKTAAQSDASN